jgi:type II secretory pathway component GspD/PulD (secretin)
MSQRVQAIAFLLLLAVAPSRGVSAQTPPAAKAVAAAAQVPMRVQFVLSKYQGEKKISSLPYTVALNSNDPPAEIRMGAQFPTPTTVVKEGTSTPTYTYNQIGVSIRCSVKPMDNGLFAVTVNVADSSIFMNPASGAPPTLDSMPLVNGVPVFKNFSINSILLLKDGQTSQLTTAADPTNGEVMKVDVTLTLIK